MTEALLDWMTAYGEVILFAVTFLSCLCVPIPSSLMMLAGGSLAATGDLTLTTTAAAAYAGAVLGDNTGYALARRFGTAISTWLEAKPARDQLRHKARAYMDRKGPISVFLSCWLVAPLGPYVNLVSGLTRYDWPRFALWGALGEIVWVGLYVGLGYTFSSQISTLATLLGNISGFLVAGLALAVLGRWLWKASAPKRSEA